LRLAWSPDGDRLAVGSAGGETLILDGDTGSIVVDIGPFLQSVRGIVWADNGRSLVVAAEHCIRLIDALTGVTLDEIRPTWAVTSIAVIAGQDGQARLAAPTETAPTDGQCLFLDVGRRLPADVPRGQ
jgi:WD40 repeat protein